MVVLGLDPGTRHFGWGVVESVGTRLFPRAFGTIHVNPDAPLPKRLAAIEAALLDVLKTHDPTHASVETLFFAKDASAAAKLGHARGVALLVCGRVDLPLSEYAPALVKRTIAGNGRAEKGQVAAMVKILLGLSAPPPSDAADALALALTHLQQARAPLALRA